MAGIGKILSFAGASAPDRWLICDGSAVSRTTYAALYAFLGTTYGSGDGSTTFNLPDYRGRTIIRSSSVTGSGGAETVVLSTSNMPQHSHGGGAFTDISSDTGAADNGGTVSQYNIPTGAFNYGSQVLTSSGSGNAHENMPAFLALNFIIKAK